MEFHQLKCPNCGADLTVENNLDTFYCKYCGTKIIVTGQSDATVKAKADIKLAEKDLEKLKMELEYKERKRKDGDKYMYQGMAGILIVIIIFLLIGFFA